MDKKKESFDSLSTKKGREAKTLLEKHKETVKKLLDEHNRNLKPVLEYLSQHLNITICKKTALRQKLWIIFFDLNFYTFRVLTP